MTTTRRLAAILAADVAGYSRLMGANEEGTLERLKAIRNELIDPTIAEHRGHIVKTTGDGLLVEFGSVVDALRCAIEWGRLDLTCDDLGEQALKNIARPVRVYRVRVAGTETMPKTTLGACRLPIGRDCQARSIADDEPSASRRG